jgi:hypothetical protein
MRARSAPDARSPRTRAHAPRTASRGTWLATDDTQERTAWRVARCNCGAWPKSCNAQRSGWRAACDLARLGGCGPWAGLGDRPRAPSERRSARRHGCARRPQIAQNLKTGAGHVCARTCHICARTCHICARTCHICAGTGHMCSGTWHICSGTGRCCDRAVASGRCCARVIGCPVGHSRGRGSARPAKGACARDRERAAAAGGRERGRGSWAPARVRAHTHAQPFAHPRAHTHMHPRTHARTQPRARYVERVRTDGRCASADAEARANVRFVFGEALLRRLEARRTADSLSDGGPSCDEHEPQDAGEVPTAELDDTPREGYARRRECSGAGGAASTRASVRVQVARAPRFAVPIDRPALLRRG